MTVREWIMEHGRQYSLSALLAAAGGHPARALFWILAGEELKRLFAVLDPEAFSESKAFANRMVPDA